MSVIMLQVCVIQRGHNNKCDNKKDIITMPEIITGPDIAYMK